MNQIPQLDNQYKKSSPHRESVFSQLFQVVFFKKLWQQVTQQGANSRSLSGEPQQVADKSFQLI